MLVLARYRDEAVVVTLSDARRIVVTVLDVRSNGQVRLGFKADPDIEIHRDEVQSQIDMQRSRG